MHEVIANDDPFVIENESVAKRVRVDEYGNYRDEPRRVHLQCRASETDIVGAADV